jgi:hypothetical protein
VKSSTEGIDLEFEKDNIRYIVAIKSGPNWGNSQQIKRLRDNFKTATKILRTNHSHINIRAVNGCCYGKDNQPDKGDYLKLCGQAFWELISNNPKFYTEIIKPISKKADEKDDTFKESYTRGINRLTKDLLNKFCDDTGNIHWEKLVEYNSSVAKIL